MTSNSRANSVNDNFSDSNTIYEVTVTLENLRRRSQSLSRQSNSIADSLLFRHKRSKSKLDHRAQTKKSLSYIDCTFFPKVSRKRYKVSYPKSTKKVQKIYDSIESKKKAKKEELSKLLRPRDVIDRPDLSTVKNLFTSRAATKPTEVKENHLKMTLTEKTSFFQKKRKTAIEQAEKKRIQKTLNECTFKPDLCKTSRRSSVKQRASNESRLSSKSSVSLTRAYSKISPDEQNIGFKEGLNLSKLIPKTKPLFKYNLVTSN